MSLPLIIQCISVFVVSFLPHLSFQTETALVAPVYKHNSTDPILFQYIIQVYLKTPLQSNKLLLDLAHPFSYMECNVDYNSSTYQHIPCNASLCHSLENVGQTKGMFSNCFFSLFSVFRNNFLFLRLKNLFGNSK